MARAYILTAREHTLLTRYLTTGEKLNGFAVLIHLLKKHQPRLAEDLDLVNRVLATTR